MLLLMRTTVRLDEELMNDVRLLARRKGTTVTALMDQALRELLLRQAQPAPQKPVRLPTFKGDGLQPGIDLDHTASLLDLLDQADVPDRR